MKNNKLKEIDISDNEFDNNFVNKLIGDNPGKKICLKTKHYLHDSYRSESSEGNSDPEDEEMEDNYEDNYDDDDYEIDEEEYLEHDMENEDSGEDIY